MAKTVPTAAEPGKGATYTFNVVVEPDQDAWFAYCPALKRYGAATWGSTREEALRHIREVVGMIIAELVEALIRRSGCPAANAEQRAAIYDEPGRRNRA
jgi:predicted RNase H-like HicB family nuclease